MIRRAGVALVVFALLPLALLAGGGPATALPEEGDALLVEATSMDPVNLAPGATLTLSGVVTNNSSQDVDDIQVVLRVSTDRLGSRSAVGSVTDLTTTRRGSTVNSTLTPVTEKLAPTKSAPFSITTAVDSLPLAGPGVYAFFIEARSDQGSFDTALPVPWIPDPSALQPSQLVVLTPLRSAVDLTAQSKFMSPDLAADLAPSGSLYSLSAASAAASSAGVPINWLIDPAVFDAAGRIADGTATLPAGISDPDTVRRDAASWQQDVIEGASGASSRTYLTPYAEVDASAVISAGQPDLLAQSITLAPSSAATALPRIDGLIAAPPGGNTTPAAIEAYAAAGVSTVVLSSAALPPDEERSYTTSGLAEVPVSGGQVTALIPDEGLAADLARPSATPAELFRWQQGLLADVAMITLELPTTARTVVMAPREGVTLSADGYAGALTALSQAPYTRLADLAGALASGATAEDLDPALDSDDQGRLSADYLAPIPGIQARLDAFARVTVDPLAFQADYQAALLRSASGQWRDDVEQGAALLGAINAELTEEEGRVTTVSTGTVTFSGNSGQLPLTISNGLDQAVEVGVLLQSEPSVRLTFTPPGLVVVEAGKRASIEVAVEVYGSGPLPVTVILTDRDGNPFITTGDLVIKAGATSKAAAVIAAIGGVAFIGLVLWRFRRKGPGDHDESI